MISRRLALGVFLVHLAATLALGYLVIPRFDSMAEPPPSDQPQSITVMARLFYFPVILEVNRMFVTGPSRPGIALAVVNSAFVALAVAALVSAVFGRKRAVA